MENRRSGREPAERAGPGVGTPRRRIKGMRPVRRSRLSHSPLPIPHSRLSRGFSLVELLVAVAVFAALAAAAYGGLAQIARTRGALAVQQDRLAGVTRAIGGLERDLRQAVGRSVRGNGNAVLPALQGSAQTIEFTHLGFANLLAEPRSNLEREVVALDGRALQQGRFAVLDRAPGTAPASRTLLDDVDGWRLRYLGCDGAWRDDWPPSDVPGCAMAAAREDLLPRAVEFRLQAAGLGEVRRLVELPATLPREAGPP